LLPLPLHYYSNPSTTPSPDYLSPPPTTIPPCRPQPRTTISPSHIKPNCLLSTLIRMSIKLQVCPNRSPSSRRTNNLIRSHPSHHPVIHNHTERQLHLKHPGHHPRAHLPHFFRMTPRNNMIHL